MLQFSAVAALFDDARIPVVAIHTAEQPHHHPARRRQQGAVVGVVP